MSWYNKVTWSEGLFLQPQLFQQQERYLEDFAHKRAAVLSPFFCGFSQYKFDDNLLKIGKLVLSSAAGIFPDGTPFDAPGHTTLPAPLTILPAHLGKKILLALPIRKPNSEETDIGDPLTTGSPSARFSVFDAEVRDANSNGRGPKAIQLSRLQLRLMPECEPEPQKEWLVLPLALVSSQLADGSFVLSSELIPPVTSYGADPVLAGWLSHLHGACRMRAGSLAARLTGSDGKSSEAVEVADFLLLQILNRYEPLLAHWLQVRDTSPEQVFITLQTLIGELSTYVRPATRRSTVRPDYKHLEPHKHFGPLFAEVQALLNDVLVRSAQSIPLAPRANGVSVASVAPAELQGFSGLVFAIAANMPPDQLAALFPARCKVAPADRLAELIRLQLPGIALQVLPVPPRQIPFNAGFVYFQVESHGALWEQMAAHGGIGLHVGGDFPGLNLQLWGVRGK